MMATPLAPKQALKFDGALLDELQGDVSSSIAAQFLALLPSLSPSATIHDNGCGAGAVTEKIMETNPPAGISIQATDTMPMFLAQLQSKIDANGWPVTAANMDGSKLTFADETFTHSFSNFMLMALPDDVEGAKHIHRTLKTAGTAVVTIWEQQPFVAALKDAHHATRGADEPVPPFLSKEWYKGTHVVKALLAGGFEEDKMKTVEKEAWLNLRDTARWATIAWTFLGTPVGGWKQEDENKWDEAIQEIVKSLKGSEHYREENGQGKLRMIASIIIAEK